MDSRAASKVVGMKGDLGVFVLKEFFEGVPFILPGLGDSGWA